MNLESWLTAFLLTQLVEVPIYFWLLEQQRRRRLFIAILASSLTHPYVWFVLPVLIQSIGYTGYVVVAESLVVLAEAGLFVSFGTSARRAGLIALAGNMTSYALGVLLLH